MKKILFAILFIAVLWLVSYSSSNLLDDYNKERGEDVAIIPIFGLITSIDNSGFPFEDSGTRSGIIVDLIEQANEEENIKGIILEINSGGGTALASKEIADAVKNSNKPVVAWIREVGASGAYWIATSADVIVADPLSITGSIGVIGSYLEFSKLFEKYGINYERLVGGEFKDVGSPFKELSNKEREILQGKIDIIHEMFIEEVAKNRGLKKEEVEKIANGMFYLGKEAKDLGLIDKFGGEKEAKESIKELADINEVNLVVFKRKIGILDILTRISFANSYFVGKGIGNGLEIDLKDFNYNLVV